MMLDTADLQGIRECCRDEAAFERLQNILAKYLPPCTMPAPQTRQIWYEAILQALPDRVFLVNRNGDSLDFKGTPEDAAHGLSRETIVGTNLREFLPEDLAQRCLEAIDRTLNSGELQTLEYELPNAWEPEGGELRAYEVRLVRSGKSEVLGIERDITTRKRSEQALRESEEKFSIVFRSSPTAMTLTTLEASSLARVIDVNDSFLQVTGYQKEEAVGLTVAELNIWVDLAARTRMLQILQESGSVRNLEMKFRRKSGEVGVALMSAEVIRLQGVSCLLTDTTDITDRKRTEQALQVSEGRNLAFLNAIPDMMFRIRRDGVYLDCKADQETDFVMPPGDMIGKTVYEVLPPETAEQRMAYIERTLETGEIQIFEYQLLNQGELRDYEARLVVSGKNEVLAIVRNMTQRKRAIAQLQANAERDRLLGLIALRIRRSLNLDQILTTTVAEVRQFLNVDRVFIGQIDAAWQGKIVAESADPEWGSILTWIVDDLYLREIRALFAQGQVQAIDDTSNASLSPLLATYYTDCHIKASIGVPIILGEAFFGVLVANQCDQSRHWTTFEIQLLEQLAVQVAIAIQQAELYQQVQTFAASLEQQVQERTAQLQQNMRELQDLSQTKDDFLNAVSHDLRTPIMGTMMVLKNLQQKAGDSVTLSRSVLERMVQSSDRQLSMINSLLEAHSSEAWGINLHCEKLSLSRLVQTIADDLDPLLTENQATLTHQVASDLPPATADPALIRRVFENLLTNALKHNPPGLHISITTTTEEDMIRCNVRDDGVGMTPEECDSLFERYVRGTRARRSTGIGLGLYLCRQIITAHGGQIGAMSAPGEGATFWFTLPQAL